MIFSLICALALTPPRSSISLQSGCERAPLLLKQISGQAGVDLHASPALEDEVLFISVKDKPVHWVLDQIASVCHAEWQKSGSELWLRRTGVQIQKDERAEIALTAQLMKKSLAAEIAHGKQGVWSAAEAQANFDKLELIAKSLREGQLPREMAGKKFKQLREGSVANRAFERLIASTNLATFADQPPGTYRVYTTHPTKYQYALSDAATESLKALATEEKYIDARISGLDRQEADRSGRDLQRYSIGSDKVGEPVDVVLTGTRLGIETVFYSAYFVDGEGRLVDLGSKVVDLMPDADLTKLDGLEQWGKDKLKASASLLKAAGSALASRGPAVARSEVHKPAEHDPLGNLLDEALTQLCSASGKDLIAALPDECARHMSGFVAETSLQAFCEQIGKFESIDAWDGAIVMAPIKRAQAYAMRMKRKPLQAIVEVCEKRIPTLDDAAGYAQAQNDHAGDAGLEEIVLSWNQCGRLQHESMEQVSSNGSGQRVKLKFYGLLSASQRSKMVSSGLALGEMTPDQLALVSSWLFNEQSRLTVFEELPDGRMHGSNSVVAREATFTLGSGLPSNATIVLKPAQELSANVIAMDGRKQMQDCSGIGYIMAQQEHGDFLEPNLGYLNLLTAKMAPGWLRKLNFEVRYSPLVWETFQLKETRIESTTYVPWQELPEDWRKAVSQTLEYYRKELKNRPPPQQHLSPPPPFG